MQRLQRLYWYCLDHRVWPPYFHCAVLHWHRVFWDEAEYSADPMPLARRWCIRRHSESPDWRCFVQTPWFEIKFWWGLYGRPSLSLRVDRAPKNWADPDAFPVWPSRRIAKREHDRGYNLLGVAAPPFP